MPNINIVLLAIAVGYNAYWMYRLWKLLDESEYIHVSWDLLRDYLRDSYQMTLVTTAIVVISILGLLI